MKLRVLFQAIMVLVPAFTAGCGGDCEEACEAAKACPQVPPRWLVLECGDGCAYYENQAETAGCAAELDALDACGADNADSACDENTCNAEGDALSACLAK